ncbi:hypothetical protein ABZZ80_46370, partial [Streptomyces sp. NPDC006356]
MVDGHPGRDGEVAAAVESTLRQGFGGVGVDRQRAGLRWHLLVEEAVVVVGRVQHHELRVEAADEGLRVVDGPADP